MPHAQLYRTAQAGRTPARLVKRAPASSAVLLLALPLLLFAPLALLRPLPALPALPSTTSRAQPTSLTSAPATRTRVADKVAVSAVSPATLDALAACLAANASQPPLSLVRPTDPLFPDLLHRSFRTTAAFPQVFLQPGSEAAVQSAVRCARRAHLRLCARSGGHDFAGSSLCDGLVLDLSELSTHRFVGDDANDKGVPLLLDDDEDTQAAGANDVVVGPAVTLGDLISFTHAHPRRRWLGAGVCPGVGVAGFVLGGGHGPYEMLLGLACDALRSFRMVDHAGRVVVASRTRHPDLFWAGCGGGGGHFGVVTQLRLRTAPAAPFDDSTPFALHWPAAMAAQLLDAIVRSPLRTARVWARVEVISRQHGPSHPKGTESSKQEEEDGADDASRSITTYVLVYGACFDTPTDVADGDRNSTAECHTRLAAMPFFRVAGMKVASMFRLHDARNLHAFIAGSGSRVQGDLSPAATDAELLGWRYSSGGAGNKMVQHAVFLHVRDAARRRRLRLWKAFARACELTRGSSLSVQVCQVNPFQLGRGRGAVVEDDDTDGEGDAATEEERLAAFAHRDADALTFSFAFGGHQKDRDGLYDRMDKAVRPFMSGVYVNYPQLQLSADEYARLYWGDRLERMQRLKREWDPDSVFLHRQPIPAA